MIEWIMEREIYCKALYSKETKDKQTNKQTSLERKIRKCQKSIQIILHFMTGLFVHVVLLGLWRAERNLYTLWPMTHVTKRTMGATEVILQHILHVANQTIKLYFPVPLYQRQNMYTYSQCVSLFKHKRCKKLNIIYYAVLFFNRHSMEIKLFINEYWPESLFEGLV